LRGMLALGHNSGTIQLVTVSPFGSEATQTAAMDMLDHVSTSSNSQCLLALDGAVDVPHEEERCAETDGAQHEEEAVADAGHVAEEEGCLHEA